MRDLLNKKKMYIDFTFYLLFLFNYIFISIFSFFIFSFLCFFKYFYLFINLFIILFYLFYIFVWKLEKPLYFALIQYVEQLERAVFSIRY